MTFSEPDDGSAQPLEFEPTSGREIMMHRGEHLSRKALKHSQSFLFVFGRDARARGTAYCCHFGDGLSGQCDKVLVVIHDTRRFAD